MYDIWYQMREKASKEPFADWLFYIPQPRNAAEAASAIKKIVDMPGWILITISRSYEPEKPNRKPSHD